METKLTLKLDKSVIDRAKSYSNRKKISLSKMVEKYFLSLDEGSYKNKKKYPALIEELSGIIKLDKDFDRKEKYASYLIEKYK